MTKLSKRKDLNVFYLILLIGLIIAIYLFFKGFKYPDKSSNIWFLGIQVVLGMIISFLPFGLETLFKFKAPIALKNLYWLFILFAVSLGTGLSFYGKFFYWDKFLHFSSAMLLAALGLGILSLLMPKFQHLSVGTIVLFGFFFAMTMGVFWEFYEFTFDGLLGLNMQRFATSSGKDLVGRAVLMDTMGDLFTNTAGAIVFSVVCFIKGKQSPEWLQLFAFTPKQKNN